MTVAVAQQFSELSILGKILHHVLLQEMDEAEELATHLGPCSEASDVASELLSKAYLEQNNFGRAIELLREVPNGAADSPQRRKFESLAAVILEKLLTVDPRIDCVTACLDLFTRDQRNNNAWERAVSKIGAVGREKMKPALAIMAVQHFLEAGQFGVTRQQAKANIDKGLAHLQTVTSPEATLMVFGSVEALLKGYRCPGFSEVALQALGDMLRMKHLADTDRRKAESILAGIELRPLTGPQEALSRFDGAFPPAHLKVK